MSHRDGGSMERDRDLDAEIAQKVMGFRWVRWKKGTAEVKALEYRDGRFLASPDHVAAAHHTRADESDPLAPAWDRFVPAFSRQIEPALEAAERAGVFRRDVTLRRGDDGCWALRTEGPGGSLLAIEGETLSMTICRAVLKAVSAAKSADEG